MLQSEESRAKPFYKFLGEEKVKKKTQLWQKSRKE
jgi:hypothetical protein